MIGLAGVLVAACWLADAAAPVLPPVTALAFAPDGKSLVVGSQHGLEIRSWPELRAVRSIDTELRQVHAIAFSPDGGHLAVAGGAPAEDGAVEVYRWPDVQKLYGADGHSDVVYAVAWSGDSAHWAAASLDGTVTVRDASDGSALDWLEGHASGVTAVAFLTEGMLVSAGLDQTLRVWDLGALSDGPGTDRAPSNGNLKVRAPKSGASSGSPPKLRAPNDDAPIDRAPTVRARNDGPRSAGPSTLRARMVRALTNHTAAVHDIALRPSIQEDRPALPWLASAGEDRTVRLWQPTIGRMVRFVRFRDATPLAVQWMPDGSRLVVGSTDGRVRILDPESAGILHEVQAVEGWACSLAVHRDGKTAAVGGERGQVVRVGLPEE